MLQIYRHNTTDRVKQLRQRPVDDSHTGQRFGQDAFIIIIYNHDDVSVPSLLLCRPPAVCGNRSLNRIYFVAAPSPPPFHVPLRQNNNKVQTPFPGTDRSAVSRGARFQTLEFLSQNFSALIHIIRWPETLKGKGKHEESFRQCVPFQTTEVRALRVAAMEAAVSCLI